MGSKQWFVYIILSEGGLLYTGITTDLERRFHEHKSSERKAKFFRGRKPVKFVFTQSFESRSAASRREAAIKKLKKADKLKLIAGDFI